LRRIIEALRRSLDGLCGAKPFNGIPQNNLNGITPQLRDFAAHHFFADFRKPTLSRKHII